jgi:Mu transposase, C-terminal domain
LWSREEKWVKSPEEIMEILEAFDLTGSYRAAAELVGCDHHTVRRYVEQRGAGLAPERMHAAQLIDPFLDKVEEWVERSRGRVGADVVHGKLTAMGYGGSERTTRRAVAAAKKSWRAGNRRVFRPWIPEPGLWLQWDWGEGPRVRGRRTQLWCGWLAWSRFRVVIPTWDKQLPTMVACLDATLRRLGGVPTYALTDNEKTVTVEHVAGVAVRHPQIVAVSRHYGMTVKTCVPEDPQTKGGSEATVRLAKRDIVPTEVNLRAEYRTFGHLEAACRQFCDEVNARVHRETGRAAVDMLAEERTRLHRLPDEPYASAFGLSRRVVWDSTISMDGLRYSVPHELIDSRVWARWAGDTLIVTAIGAHGSREVARHQRASKANPAAAINDEHYPPRDHDPLDREPTARTAEEAAFLAIGPGAIDWLKTAAASGAGRVRSKMAQAVTLAKLYGADAVDRALFSAAVAGRFADADLASILTYQRAGGGGAPIRASDTHSLQPGTAAWSGFGHDGNAP